MTRKEEILKQIEALQKELEMIEAAEQQEPAISIEVTEKETSKGIKYNYVITIDGREFKRSSVKRYNYCFAAKYFGKWIIDGFGTTEKSLQSKISYYNERSRYYNQEIEMKILEIK